MKTYDDYWKEGRKTVLDDQTIDFDVLMARIDHDPKEPRSKPKQKQMGNWLAGYITALFEANLLTRDEFTRFFNQICWNYKI